MTSRVDYERQRTSNTPLYGKNPRCGIDYIRRITMHCMHCMSTPTTRNKKNAPQCVRETRWRTEVKTLLAGSTKVSYVLLVNYILGRGSSH